MHTLHMYIHYPYPYPYPYYVRTPAQGRNAILDAIDSLLIISAAYYCLR